MIRGPSPMPSRPTCDPRPCRQTDYPSATLVYEGVVDDAIPGEMTGDVFELSDRGGAGTKAGTFTLKQVP